MSSASILIESIDRLRSIDAPPVGLELRPERRVGHVLLLELLGVLLPLALGALQAHAMSSPSLTRAGIGMLGNLACANRRAVERAVGAEYAADVTGATAAAVAAGLQAIASEDDRASGNANDGATKSDAHADEGGAGGGDDDDSRRRQAADGDRDGDDDDDDHDYDDDDDDDGDDDDNSR